MSSIAKGVLRLTLNGQRFLPIVSILGQHQGVRFYRKRNVYPQLRDLNERREKIALDQNLRHGKEERPRRSDYVDWNYNAELVAFQARLGEKFDDSKLRDAFISSDYFDAEKERQRDLEITTDFCSNIQLAESGRKVIEESLRGYLRWAMPFLPEEGVDAFTHFLMQKKLLAHVSFHIGTMDLILSEEYPPNQDNMATTFEAIIGAMEDKERAQRLVLDLVAIQLQGEDLSEIWDIADPMSTLASVLSNEKRGEPEARLLWVSGKETLLACYHVGIYSDKELIGQAPGETALIAEEMAARDALRKLFKFDTASKPLPFGRQIHESNFPTKPNPTLKQWKSQVNVV